MAVLARIAVLVSTLVGCYSPELRDCTVTCASASECGAEQVCGSDGFCAAPAMAGRCLAIQTPGDAGHDADAPAPPPHDAAPPPPPIDAAPPPPDAPPALVLDVKISGRGKVVVDGIGTCDSQIADHCMFGVSAGAMLELEAIAHAGARFDKWDSPTCAQDDETCTVVAAAPITFVKAKFKNNGGDDDDDEDSDD